ncbi:ATP synthase subunit C [Nitzschia inconspicua]|uniref:ATP synthase subunit C n=1 Tax=Nitzschia inconspicua TaxID=303405 RepID=A0A9K3Q272_9STRA|nr:ATP synthase subunit C [Nitzschia inconspicua]
MSVDPSFLTGLGAALSIFLAALGSAIASGEAGVYALRSKSGLIYAFVPIIISGVLAIYGIIISVVLAGKLHGAEGDDGSTISAAQGYRYLCAGLSVGLACAASGLGMASFIKQSNVGFRHSTSDSTVASESAPLLGNGNGHTTVSVPHCDHKYMLVMVFLEAIALYGLIVALFLVSK